MNKLLASLISVLILSVSFSADVIAATKKPTKQEIAQKEELRKADEAKRRSDEEALKAEEESRKKFIDGANSVIKSYRKLQYKIDAGINFKEYQQVFSDAQVDLSMFKNSPEGQYKDAKYDDFWTGLIGANQSYRGAAGFWRMSIYDIPNNMEELKEQALSDVKESLEKAKEEVDKAVACLTK